MIFLKKFKRGFPTGKIWYSCIIVLLLIMGCSSETPQQLLIIISNSDSASSIQQSTEVRLEALRSLLQLQKRKFGVNIPPIECSNTMGIDHIFIDLLRSSTNSITVMATPTKQPNKKAEDGDYWNCEEFTFDKSGKLLRREPVKN